MTKKYQNRTSMMRSITFVDGSSQFLMRGQSIVTDKPVIDVQPGITVKEVKSAVDVKKVVVKRPEGAARRSIRTPSQHAIRRMKQRRGEAESVVAEEAKREDVESVDAKEAKREEAESVVAKEAKREEVESVDAKEAKPVKKTRAKQKPVEEVKGENSEK